MDNLSMSNIDEITMRLVHYFITKEEYQPVIVNGLDNEIWLENSSKKYGVIRINTNYIHNDEQLNFDIYKTKSIVRQIKKKAFLFGSNTLSILLNVGDNVKKDVRDKYVDVEIVDSIDCLSNGESISSLFPEIKNDVIDANDDMDFFINVTNDINDQTEKKNKLYEKTFKQKTIVVTYALIAINLLVFILSLFNIINVSSFWMEGSAFKNGEYYRAFTAMFFHWDIIHLACNMYSLYIIGTQIENVMGKLKFLIIYILSGIIGCLLSGVINTSSVSAGASGAIFGLMGAMIYFGYHYRLYLGQALRSQIIPIVVLNLFISFAIPNIDAFGHIGGLVGGLFATMIVGIEGKTDKTDTINGIIVTTILIGFLIYMLLFR